jgi:hypothetical protein
MTNSARQPYGRSVFTANSAGEPFLQTESFGLMDGKHMRTFEGNFLEVSSDDNWLATMKSNALTVWDISKGKVRWKLPTSGGLHPAEFARRGPYQGASR